MRFDNLRTNLKVIVFKQLLIFNWYYCNFKFIHFKFYYFAYLKNLNIRI